MHARVGRFPQYPPSPFRCGTQAQTGEVACHILLQASALARAQAIAPTTITFRILGDTFVIICVYFCVVSGEVRKCFAESTAVEIRAAIRQKLSNSVKILKNRTLKTSSTSSS